MFTGNPAASTTPPRHIPEIVNPPIDFLIYWNPLIHNGGRLLNPVVQCLKAKGGKLNREESWQLLCEYTKNENLRRHALAVEACMRAYARKFGHDEEKWAVAGLLHDFDYELYPNPPDHPLKGSQILNDRGYPEDVRLAILAHADYTGVARDSLMAKTLFACDELAGFITACALVRPDRIQTLEPKSVRKRMKDKAFARAVRREDIITGAAELGVDTNEHIALCIKAMQGIGDRLGLNPNPPSIPLPPQQS